MRVMLLVHSLRRGGAERILLEVAVGLTNRGHHVEVCTLLDVDEYREARYAQIRRHCLIRKEDYRWPWAVLRAAWRLRVLVRAVEPEVIETHTATVNWVLALTLSRIPSVFVIHGYGPLTRPPSLRARAVQLIDQFVWRRLKPKVVVVSPAMITCAARYFGMPIGNFTYVLNGVDTSIFVGKGGKRKGFNILMVGTLSSNKGQLSGITALSLVRAAMPSTSLWIVGEGECMKELSDAVKGAGLTGVVHLLGLRSDVPDLMLGADVLWHLSKSEGLPMVVLEAMACGLPTVGFDVCGTREVIEDEETGCLVTFGDIEGVARATTRLFSDSSFYKKVSRRAREQAIRRFSIAAMVRGHESVLSESVSGKRL